MNSPGLQAGEKEQTYVFFSSSPPAALRAAGGEEDCVSLLIPRLKPGAIHDKRYSKVVM